MSKRETLKSLFEKADSVKKFAEKDGETWTDFEGAAVLNSINAMESKTGMQTRNKDGSLARTGKTVHAVNPDYFYANRYKVKGKKMILVSGHTTDGYRCIKEQSSGRIFIKSVPVYVLSRNADGELVVEKMTTCPDTEFIGEFTETLAPDAMAQILPLLTAYGSDKTATSLPI